MEMTDDVLSIGETHERLRFCINQLEKAKNFKKGISWGSEIVPPTDS